MTSFPDFKQYLTDNYLQHEVFCVLTDFADFYKGLSWDAFNYLSQGVRDVVFNIDSYVYSSMEGTLDSIKLILEKGRINDAFALARKYHDAVMIDIFKALLIREKYDPLGNKWTVKQIDDWVHGKGKFPCYENMMKYISRIQAQAGDPRNYLDENRYEKIRNKCNDHQHYNSYNIMLLNDNEISNENRIKELGQLAICLKDIFTLHFAYLFHLHPEYTMSSDYADYMDAFKTPPEGCQYWVAPFIQDAFDKYIKPRRPELANYIKESSCMELS